MNQKKGDEKIVTNNKNNSLNNDIKINIMIVDDSAITRFAVTNLLNISQNKFFKIVEASTVDAALKLIERIKIDIVLLDIKMPDRDGFEILKYLTIKKNIRVLILTGYPDELLIKKVLNYKFHGFITKGCSAKELIKAVKIIYDGGKYVEASLSQKIFLDKSSLSEKSKNMLGLSPREVEIFNLLLKNGKKDKEIARILNIDPRTLGTLKSRLLKKLNVENVMELTRFAINNQIIEKE